MATYVEQALIKGESIIYQGQVSLWSLSHLIVIGVILFIGGLFTVIGSIIGLAFLLVAYVRYSTTELAVTNKRVIAKFGFISRQTIEINMSKIESIQVHQGLLGRIFNFGSLVISGAGAPNAPIPGISAPMEFRRAFAEAQDAQE